MRRVVFILALLCGSAFAQDTLTGLVLAYKTIEGSGTTLNDSSSFANTGTVTSATWTTTSISPLTNALVYSSTSTHSDAGNHSNTAFSNTQPFSIAAWIQTNTANTQQTIVSTLNFSSNDVGYEFTVAAGSNCTGGTGDCLQVYLISNIGTPNYIGVTAPALLSTNTVYFVVMTYDGSQTAAGVKIYTNAVSQSTTIVENTLSATIANTENVRIGLRQNATDPFKGDIGPVYLYNRALAQADITSLYSSPYLLAYYPAHCGACDMSLLENGGRPTPEVIPKLNRLQNEPGFLIDPLGADVAALGDDGDLFNPLLLEPAKGFRDELLPESSALRFFADAEQSDFGLGRSEMAGDVPHRFSVQLRDENCLRPAVHAFLDPDLIEIATAFGREAAVIVKAGIDMRDTGNGTQGGKVFQSTCADSEINRTQKDSRIEETQRSDFRFERRPNIDEMEASAFEQPDRFGIIRVREEVQAIDLALAAPVCDFCE